MYILRKTWSMSIVLSIGFTIFNQLGYSQSVGINSSGASPNASSMLDVASTGKGLLLPRMSAAQRDGIGSPATGLLVFVNDDNTFYYYNGTSWVPLFGDNAGWKTLGNGSTSAATNFVGTTDAVDLVIRTNNAEVGRFKSGGNLGINEPSPELPIHVNRTGANSEAIWNAGYFVSTKTSNMGDGFGTGIRFRIEDDAGVQNSIASISAQRRGADNSGRLRFGTYDGGVLTDHFYILPNGNVGIGASSPTALLQLLGDNTEKIRVENLTAGTPANYFSFYDTGGRTGWEGFGSNLNDDYYISNETAGGSLRFLTNSADRMWISSSGEVGIGTTTPSAILNLSVASAVVDGTKGIKIDNPAGTIVMLETGSSHDSYVGTNSGSDFHIRSNSANRISLVSADGHVGIGDESADAHLEISVDGTTGSNAFLVSSNDALDGDLFTIKEDGKVGIGETAPEFILDVSTGSYGGTKGTSISTVSIENNSHVGLELNSPSGFFGSIYFRDEANPINLTTGLIRYRHTDNVLLFGSNGAVSNLVYIDSDNDLGIGDETPDAHLEVSANGTTGGNVFLVSSNDALEGDLFTIKETGRVGIGANNPTYKLHVSTSANGDRAIFGRNNSTGTTTQYGIYGEKSGNTGTANGYAFYGQSTGTGNNNHGLYAFVSGATFGNTGIEGAANGAGTLSYGVRGTGQGASSGNYGGFFDATGATGGVNYGVRGNASNATSDCYGLWANAVNAGGDNYGVYANAGGATGNNYALFVQGGETKISYTTGVPTRSTNGSMAVSTSSGNRIYFRAGNTNYYVSSSGTGDYSEYFRRSDQTLEIGEIVAIDPTDHNAVRKADYNKGDAQKIIGIVSKYGTQNNNTNDGDRGLDEDYVNVGLIGQVQLKVSTENGNIEPGDPLTLSTTEPGFAMKANKSGYIVGYAMTHYPYVEGEVTYPMHSGSKGEEDNLKEPHVMVYVQVRNWNAEPSHEDNDEMASKKEFNEVLNKLNALQHQMNQFKLEKETFKFYSGGKNTD